MFDAQIRPVSVPAIETQRPDDALDLAGLLLVGYMHLGDPTDAPSGRHWVAIRKDGRNRNASNSNPPYADSYSGHDFRRWVPNLAPRGPDAGRRIPYNGCGRRRYPSAPRAFPRNIRVVDPRTPYHTRSVWRGESEMT